MPQNFASNGQIFIDMPGPRGASKQLLTVTKFDAKADGKVDVVVTIGVQGGAGWRETQGGFKIDMTMVRLASAQPEVDFDYALATKKIFTITTQDEGNGRRQAYTCRVSKTDTSMDDAGKFEDMVEIAAILKVTNS